MVEEGSDAIIRRLPGASRGSMIGFEFYVGLASEAEAHTVYYYIVNHYIRMIVGLDGLPVPMVLALIDPGNEAKMG